MSIDIYKMDRNASRLYRNRLHGILSTVSKVHDDYPFGSFVTYISSRSRTAYLYLSDLAEHTENLHYKSKSCLTIFKANNSGDIQNSQRLTLVGDLGSVPDNDIDHCQERFHSLLPDSKKYAEMHDFKFYQLTIKHARWIGGFGQIAWLDQKKWSDISPEWHDNERRIIDHMNEDHNNSICSALHAQYGIKDQSAKMSFLSIDGYYTKSKNAHYFIQFPDQCTTMKEFKNALVRLAKKYREFEL